jgi:hypothetical protein
MTKKEVKKKTSKKKAGPKKKDEKVEKILIENFVSLQKVMVDLTSKFDGLTKRIDSLLNLFEDSAKALVKRDFHEEKDEQKELIEKLNSIVDQNKLIAKGLTLMHETASDPTSSYSLAPQSEKNGISKIPGRDIHKPKVKEEPELDVPEMPQSGFQKSFSDKNIP